ncbi:hypothetical protein QN277_013920 [Acacia crassicarpa]|uniref:Bromo domain-containing protein n=1 Tax=Acacia crassicarpa TaxID=499986 RepID=A0AAE1TGA2_9FABA|nr:hypothetical protein QN277_013920 [Acacia crassicarpa]
MDSRKCMASTGASLVNVPPLSFTNQVDKMARPCNDKGAAGHAVDTDVDIDLREVYFLIMHFLSAGPCKKTFEHFWNELLEHQLLPRRYHAWFSRSGLHSGNDDDDGISLPLNYNVLLDRYSHIAKDHLVKLLKQLMLSTAHPMHSKLEGSTPNAADVPTLLGSGSFSLLDVDRKTADKQVKPLPAYLRWPHMQANQVQGLYLREIGGGFTRHHRAPSIRSACYAIAKPSTMVQKMQNIKKLRGHRVAVYCAIFDRSGRYVISGSDDRLVKVWSMETAFCLASCRGHEGDITDLAVSSNNALVASASNDFVIRVWRLPDGMPISVLRGHTGAVTTIAFSPRPSAIYQLLSSSDDGTCRIWDARYSQCNPRIYLPRPSDSSTGKNNGPSTNLPSSSNGQQSYQILCCAYNANGTVFVTGSSDNFARVWSAFKSNSDDSEQPVHEMDLLAGHEDDVNYVQFSGCSVASKFSTSDSLKEENVPKFRNSWFCHDNIVTCSRDGSAIIWVPRSRRSHGKVGRWTRAYHLKVPPPPLPPQPPRGGPRQRFLPTPRGVNMIVWSLDNRFVLAAIMDCRICVWNAVDGSLVHSLTGHTASSYVLDVHPFNPRIAMSAGYDGQTIVWDIWEGVPIRTYEIGRFKLVDGKFSPDGTSIVLSDDVGQIYLLNTGQGESQKDAKYDQFFLGDYRPLVRDTQGNVLDQETQLTPYRRNIQDPLCDSSMVPYPEPYQSQFQQRRLGTLGIEWRPSSIKFVVGPDFSVGQDYQVIPLADLERIVEPQPEFIDAMFWEPEVEIISDDNDSEYNVNDDNSSEAEQGSIGTISSSDPECSGDGWDSLRRSRRKKQNVEAESTTSSGRRVRKRNLNDCDGAPSGSNRLKKSKNSQKSSKRKSSNTKTLRPQRIAARIARNMLSQMDEISTTDGEDADLEDESSDSLQDSDVISEPERNIQNMCKEHKQPFLDGIPDASKLPAHSESQANVGNRRKLVLKFSLRDSKNKSPSENMGHACHTKADMGCQSSKSLESIQESVLDKSSTDPASSFIDVNAAPSQSHDTIEDKIDTSKSSTLTDAMLTDPGLDDHLGQNTIGRPEHLATNDIERMSCRSHPKSAHLDSALQSSLLGDHYLNGDDKRTEDSLERTEINPDLKMKATMNSTKLVLKKKQNSEGNRSPCKLKFVIPQIDSEKSSFMASNLGMEVPKEGDYNDKISSQQLLRSYSDNKVHDHTQRKDRSSKCEVNPEVGTDMEESSRIVSRYSENDRCDPVSDPIRRTRSIRIKTTSEESNNMNLRIKIRGGQNSGGTLNQAGSSADMSDQLHRRSRPSRNRRGGYFADDSDSLIQRMSNPPIKKLPWLMLSEHEEGYRYIPQLGDEVVYLRQGHQEYIESCQSNEVGPWRSTAGLRAVEICKVEELDYATVAGSGDSCCKLKLRFVDPSSNVCGKSFKLTLPELINFPDFVVEKTWYDTAMRRNWSPRDKCMVWWRNANGEGGSWWEGRILSAQAKSLEFPDSPWERYLIQYKTDPTETHLHSPWELYDPEIQLEYSHIGHEVRNKLLSYFYKLIHKDSDGIQALNRAAEKSDFLNRFPVPLYPQLILSRLKNDYYRSVEAVKHDIMVMLTNAENFFTKNPSLLSRIKRISDWFRRKLERIEKV